MKRSDWKFPAVRCNTACGPS